MNEPTLLGEPRDVSRYHNHALAWPLLLTILLLIVAIASRALWGWALLAVVGAMAWYQKLAAGRLATVRLVEEGLELCGEGPKTVVPWEAVRRVGFGDGSQSRASSQVIRWRRDFNNPFLATGVGRSRFAVIELGEKLPGWGRRVAVPFASPAAAIRFKEDLDRQLASRAEGPFR